ncbi:MAG: helix-turn-helix domain-containing protein [Acidilobaceae archaeon]
MGYNYAGPYLCFALCYKKSCLLINAFENSFESYNSIAARIYRAGIENGNSMGMWVRVSFNDKARAEEFLRRLKRSRITYRIVYTAKNNFVAYISHASPCLNECPIVKTPPKVMVKTAIVTGMGVLLELLSFNKKYINEFIVSHKCKVLKCGTLKETMKYLLTSREQEAIYTAYSKGYYEVRRKIRLKDLAEELNMSTSALNETLRSAEKKIIEAFMKHDLPHLTFEKLVSKKLRESQQEIKV